jgi:hypothetical protein
MGSPLQAMLASGGVGVGGGSSEWDLYCQGLAAEGKSDPNCPPTQPAPPAPSAAPAAAATPAPAAPGHISGYQVPGPTQIKMGMTGAQLSPAEQLQASLGEAAAGWQAAPPTAPPGATQIAPGAGFQPSVLDLLMRRFTGG